MWVIDNGTAVYAPSLPFTEIGTLNRGAEVTVIHTNVLNRQSNLISEISYNGGTAYIQYDGLSRNYIEGRWAEPRARDDIASLLMAKVQAYRVSKGIRKFENPYVYYDVNNPGIGDYLVSKGLRVAKKCCMEKSANHEGGQIGAGYYTASGFNEKPSAETVAVALYNAWYNSPGHNANMLWNDEGYDGVNVAVMTVVEWYDGTYWNFCGIMTETVVFKSDLPDGLN